MVFHENRLPADDFHDISYLIFFQKLGKMLKSLSSAAVVVMFNIPPTAKVIWRRGHGLKSHPTNWRSRESNLRPLVYKASGLSTTPQWLCAAVVIGALRVKIDKLH